MHETNETDLEHHLATKLRREIDTFVRPYDPTAIAKRAMAQPAGTSRLVSTAPMAFAATLMVTAIVLAYLATVVGLGILSEPAGGRPSPVPSATAAVDALTLPTAWPPLPADPAFTATCKGDLQLNSTLLFQDRRSQDFAIVMLKHDATVSYCDFSRAADGTRREGASLSSVPWRQDHGLATGSAGLTIQGAANGESSGDWSYLVGLAPARATTIRLVVGGRSVVAVMADGVYSMGWQSADVPTLLVAYDAAGNGIDRIGQGALGSIFTLPCQPESLGGCATASP